MFPYWLVIGLVVVAVIISVVYLYWIRDIQGYTPLEIENNDVYIIGKIIDPLFPDKPALLAVYREEHPQEPWRLNAVLEKKLKEKYPNHIIKPVHVCKEPGYNSYRIWNKQTEWAKNTYLNWKASLFYLATFPVELVLRWVYLPIWTVIDFVSHDRRAVAALVIPPDLPMDALSQDQRSEEADISIVETYGQLYFRANPPEIDGMSMQKYESLVGGKIVETPLKSHESNYAGLPTQDDVSEHSIPGSEPRIRAPDGPSDLPLPLWANGPGELSDAPTTQWAERWQQTAGLAEPCDSKGEFGCFPSIKEGPLYTSWREEIPRGNPGDFCYPSLMRDCVEKTAVYPSSRLTRKLDCPGGKLPSTPARWKSCTTLEETMREGLDY